MKTGNFILFLLLSTLVQAQMEKEIVYPSQVKQFYAVYPNKTAWVHDGGAPLQLYQLLDSASNLGLQQRDYQFNFIARFRTGAITLANADDSLAADYHFTDAAIHFLRDVMVGNSGPEMGYNGLNYSPDWSSVPAMLASALSAGQLPNLLKEFEPRSVEYNALKDKLIQYNKIPDDTMYEKEQVISSRSLNVPLPGRVLALNRAINTVRWLHGVRQMNDHIIVVNIPSASLIVFEPDGITMSSKVIVGQKTHRTPTLCSKIEDVVLYPYWMVPKKIATKELLPLIKKNPGYLDANGYQVLDLKGRLVNPYSISWDSLSVNYFPYVLRQSTGCDNSLGVVKLNFYNPYTVYLHDTPWKSLFNLNKRFFSHGCMRVEKAVDLAKLVVKDKSAFIDSLIDKGCLRNQEPIVIPAREKMPVFVLYNTAWIDASATVQFFEDIYRKFPRQR